MIQRIIDAVESNFGENDGNQKQVNPDGMLTVAPIWGLPIATRQFQCDVFMLMPFREEFRAVYAEHIQPIARSFGLDMKLGDDFFSKHDIVREIWSAIHSSKFVIADCTGKNANVFYELGMAHILGKPAIMITQNEEDIPFDVQAKRYIQYENTSEGLHQLEEAMKTAIMKLMSELDE